MILVVDPDIFYLDEAKKALETLRFDVLIAEEKRELIRLCFDYRDEISVILFDPTRIEAERGLIEGIEYALRHTDISGTNLLKWNLYDWRKKQNVSSSKSQVRNQFFPKDVRDYRVL